MKKPRNREWLRGARALASAYLSLWFLLPNLISGLRKPIAIQAVVSFNMNLPE